MKIAAETMNLSKRLGDKRAIEIMAEAGFDCIDYTMSDMTEDTCKWNQDDYQEQAKELRKYAESLGLFFHQAHAPCFFKWETPGIIEETVIPRTIRCLEIAGILGVETVIVHPLHYRNYIHNMELVWKENIAFFKQLIPYAEKYGVKIALENLFQFDERGVARHDTCSDAKRYIAAIESLNSPCIVACVDVGHAHLVGDSPAELIRALGHDRVQALHIHDNQGVVDDHMLPYLGTIDWEDLTKALAEIDYDGVFTLEILLFYKKFEDDFLPIAARWVREMGQYLAEKVEQYREKEKK